MFEVPGSRFLLPYVQVDGQTGREIEGALNRDDLQISMISDNG
jgi:hypothetical protein